MSPKFTLLYLIFSLGLLVTFCHLGYRQPVGKQEPRTKKEYRDLDLIIPLKGIKRLNHFNPFGERRGSRRHLGIDIFAPQGTPVLAPRDGRIVRMTKEKNAGNYIWLLDFEGNYLYEFMHLQKFSRKISPGKKIRKGTIIGYVGNTGNARGSSAHLHFGIAGLAKKGDVFSKKHYLNPTMFFK